MSILVIGDIMLDRYAFGSVVRLNPESPAPLLRIDREENRLGGAANTAANIASMGGVVSLFGAIGRDTNAEILQDLLRNQTISSECITTDKPTITKQRFIETTYHQQLLRADYEGKYELDTDQKSHLLQKIRSLQPNYIIISDYEKGTLDRNFSESIITLARDIDAKILADIKPSSLKFYKGVHIIKPNWKEFLTMTGLTDPISEEEIDQAAREFTHSYSTTLVVTRGAHGALVCREDGEIIRVPTLAQKVFDVSGAGDTFIAILTLALDRGYSLFDAVRKGNEASGVVVGKVGTAIVSPGEFSL